MKPGCLLLCIAAFSGSLWAEAPDTCAGLEGAVLTRCRANEQTLRQQERLEVLLQEQQERQIQLDKQQREVQQQLETMRLQNESLRRQLQHEIANPPGRPAAASSTESSSQDLKDWKSQNPWFGSDYPRTQFAMRYARQLQQERPELTGRPLLDELASKVNETFGGPGQRTPVR